MTTTSRTPYTILGCLTVEAMSGYDVKQFLERSVVHFWSESYGQIYPALRKLEDDGLVEGRDEPGERGQEKRVYRITDAGREDRARYRAREEELEERAEREPASRAPYWLVVLRGGVLYSEMVLEWCDESASRLRDLREAGADDGPAQAPPTPGESDG